ncbi:SGNH/GDSL hydrolase family protein [Gordonia sp. DT218]|uniref:SGNH/GDSL hydrolase family protein n=1 Tax=unclassified Gordonia (in: high G+C Gram-positive bacteria) TaxID=2657482 RepID=UPI003CE92AA5
MLLCILLSGCGGEPPLHTPLRISIIGDSYTTGSAMGGYGDRNWTKILRSELWATHGIALQTQTLAAGGSGYVKRGIDGTRFADDGALVHPRSQVVIVFGSRNDIAAAGAVGNAADDVYSAIRARVPDAKLLVVGAPWVDGAVPEPISTINSELATEAEVAGAEFADPAAANWLAGGATQAVGADGIHPTDYGHRLIAAHMEHLLLRVTSGIER